MNSQELDELCTAALCDADATVRNQAADQLRFLSSYNHWEQLQQLTLTTTSNHTLFVCAKAMEFIVTNEIGPQERMEIQHFILKMLASPCASAYPPYILNALLGIYASALYLNWRMMVISADDDETPEESLGSRIQSAITSVLPLDTALRALTEITAYFASQDQRIPLRIARSAFSTKVVPHFFAFGTRSLRDSTRCALALCATCLSSVPSRISYTPYLRCRASTSDEILDLSPMSEWYPSLVECLSFCRKAALDDGENASEEMIFSVLHCTRLIACVTTDNLDCEVGCGTRTDYLSNQVAISEDLVRFAPKAKPSRRVQYMETGLSVLQHLFETSSAEVQFILALKPEFVQHLMGTAHELSTSWCEEEATCRTVLTTIMGHMIKETNPTSSDDLRACHVRSMLLDGLTEMCEGVVLHAHIEESSPDINIPGASDLSCEGMIESCAKATVFAIDSMYPVLCNAWEHTVGLYNLSMEARQTGTDVSDEELLSLALLCCHTPLEIESREQLMLCASHVILSRISSLVYLFAAVVKEHELLSLFGDAKAVVEICDKVGQFAKLFVSEDLTDVLLTMNLSAPPSGCTAKKLHLGIVRSLFFFCKMILRHSSLTENGLFHSIVTQLATFVMEQHSTCPILSIECSEVLEECLPLPFVEKLAPLVDSAFRGRVALLQPSVVLNEETRRARKKVVGVFALLLEAAHCGTGSLLSWLARTALEGNFSVLAFDVRAVAKKVHTPSALLPLIEWLPDVLSPLQVQRPSSEDIIVFAKSIAVVARACTQILGENLLSPIPVRFSHAAFELYGLLSSSSVRGVETVVVVGDFLHSVLGGSWCNVAVMNHCGCSAIRSVVSSFLVALVESNYSIVHFASKRDALFLALADIFGCAFLRGYLKTAHGQTLWMKVLDYLTKCLGVAPCLSLLRATEILLENASQLVDNSCVCQLFCEAAVLLATCNWPADALGIVCNVLHMCYMVEPSQCDSALEKLLEETSAFHRVRFRCLLMILRNPPVDFTNFTSIFGGVCQTPSTLSAW